MRADDGAGLILFLLQDIFEIALDALDVPPALLVVHVEDLAAVVPKERTRSELWVPVGHLHSGPVAGGLFLGHLQWVLLCLPVGLCDLFGEGST